jgi:hypothetical protein
MSSEPLGGSDKKAEGSLVLEVGLQPGEVPLRIPVAVQNFAAGLLTLKVTQALPWVDWDAVSGHDSRLLLPEAGAEKAGVMEGKVAWIRQPDPEGASIFLGVAMTQPASQVQQALEDRVLHTPKDMKDLWQQWDRVQVKTRRATVSSTLLLVLGVALLAAGGMWTAAGRLPPSLGYGFLTAGGILTISGGVRFWRQRRV